MEVIEIKKIKKMLAQAEKIDKELSKMAFDSEGFVTEYLYDTALFAEKLHRKLALLCE